MPHLTLNESLECPELFHLGHCPLSLRNKLVFSYPGKSEAALVDEGICRQCKTVFACRCMLVGAFDLDLVVGAIKL